MIRKIDADQPPMGDGGMQGAVITQHSAWLNGLLSFRLFALKGPADTEVIDGPERENRHFFYAAACREPRFVGPFTLLNISIALSHTQMLLLKIIPPDTQEAG